MARPTKLTPEVQAQIVKAVALGVTYKDAAGSVGVRYETLNEWINRGQREKSGRYHQFNHALENARSEALQRFTLVITKAAQDGDWKAAHAYLKAHDRATWGDALDVTSGGKALKGYVVISPDDWEKDTPE